MITPTIPDLFLPRLSVLVLLLFISLSGNGQSGVLHQYVQEGLNNNLALKERQMNFAKSQQALREAKSYFFPNLSFQASYTLAGGGRALEFPVGDMLNPVYATLNQLTESNMFPTNIENVNENFLPNNFHETKLRLVQPVFNTDIYYGYKAQQELVGVEELKWQAYRQELTMEIKTAYFQYLQAHAALDIYRESMQVLKELLRVNEKLVKAQKATPDVLSSTRYEISILQKQLSEAEKQDQMARAYFNFLLNRPLDQAVEIDPDLAYSEGALPKLELAHSQARSRRLEIEQLNKAASANRQLLRMQQLYLVPDVNLVVDGGFQGFGYKFNSDQDFWLANISLQWDLFQGQRNKARLEQARIQQEMIYNQQQQVQDQISLQVQQAFYDVQTARAAIHSSEAGLLEAKEAYRLIHKRYENQQAPFIELLDARTRLENAQVTLNIDRYALLSKMAEFEYSTGTTNY